MSEPSTEPRLGRAAPLFISRDVSAAVAFYHERLGFEVQFLAPEDDPFFAIVGRDEAQLFLKVIDDDTPPLPNAERHPWARWDAFIHTADPDALAAEFAGAGVTFHAELADGDDGLRGFEIADADGYVLFFGRPVE